MTLTVAYTPPVLTGTGSVRHGMELVEQSSEALPRSLTGTTDGPVVSVSIPESETRFTNRKNGRSGLKTGPGEIPSRRVSSLILMVLLPSTLTIVKVGLAPPGSITSR